MSKDLDLLKLLEYEIFSSWWAGWLPWSWTGEIESKYFLWKTQRKLDAYQAKKKVLDSAIAKINDHGACGFYE